MLIAAENIFQRSFYFLHNGIRIKPEKMMGKIRFDVVSAKAITKGCPAGFLMETVFRFHMHTKGDKQ